MSGNGKERLRRRRSEISSLRGMEAITLIKHWHRRRKPRSSDSSLSAPNEAPMVVGKEETHDGHSSSDADDEGPFFDLEFEVPDGNDGGMQGAGRKLEEEEEVVEKGEEMEEEEFNFPSCVGGDGDVLAFPVSPSDDLFFKGKLVVPVSNTASSTTTTTTSSTTTTTTSTPTSSCSLGLGSETTKPLFLPDSFLKSATRFRVLMTGLKKSNPSISDNRAKRSQKRQFFTVKFRIEDVRVPNFSLFTRDNKGRTTGTPLQTKPDGITPPPEETEAEDEEEDEDVEKGFKREVLRKYLEKIRPLYMRATAYRRHISTTSDDSRSGDVGGLDKSSPEEESNNNSESERDRDKAEPDGESSPEESVVLERVEEEVTERTAEKVEIVNSGNTHVATRGHKLVHAAGHLPAGLRAVCDNLVKKKPTPAPDSFPMSALVGRRRDDSLMQQQDGIQSAINHCKRSLHTKELECGGGGEMDAAAALPVVMVENLRESVVVDS